MSTESTPKSGIKKLVGQVLVLAAGVAVGMAFYNIGTYAAKKYLPV